MEFVCIAVLPFVVLNCYKYFFKAEFRKDLNEYHMVQKALPREEREGYSFDKFLQNCSVIGIVGFAIVVLLSLILKFFNLL